MPNQLSLFGALLCVRGFGPPHTGAKRYSIHAPYRFARIVRLQSAENLRERIPYRLFSRASRDGLEPPVNACDGRGRNCLIAETPAWGPGGADARRYTTRTFSGQGFTKYLPEPAYLSRTTLNGMQVASLGRHFGLRLDRRFAPLSGWLAGPLRRPAIFTSKVVVETHERK